MTKPASVVIEITVEMQGGAAVRCSALLGRVVEAVQTLPLRAYDPGRRVKINVGAQETRVEYEPGIPIKM